MPGHQGENLFKIGPNKFMGGDGVCGRGEKGGAFSLVCIFHNQKMHVYLIICMVESTTSYNSWYGMLLRVAQYSIWGNLIRYKLI